MSYEEKREHLERLRGLKLTNGTKDFSVDFVWIFCELEKAWAALEEIGRNGTICVRCDRYHVARKVLES